MNYILTLDIYFKTPHIHKVRRYIADVEKRIGRSLIILRQEKRDRDLFEVFSKVNLSSTTILDAMIESFLILSHLSRAVSVMIPVHLEHNRVHAYIHNEFIPEYLSFIDIWVDTDTESEAQI